MLLFSIQLESNIWDDTAIQFWLKRKAYPGKKAKLKLQKSIITNLSLNPSIGHGWFAKLSWYKLGLKHCVFMKLNLN
jgi:hypothetical protein